MNRALRLLFVALLASASSLLASRLPSRPGDALVHDLSGTLAPAQLADLERRADTVLRTGADVAILVRTRRPDSEETQDDARRLLTEWEVETKPGRGDGVAIVVDVPEGDPRGAGAAIRVGGALEVRLPSREVERIRSDVLQGTLRERNVAAGLAAALDEIAATLRHGPPPPTVEQLTAEEIATGPLLPFALAAATAGVLAAARLGRRRVDSDPSRRARDLSLGPVRGGVLARGRIGDGAGLAGLLDLASRGGVTIGTGPGGTILARPAGAEIGDPFGKALRAVVEEHARKSGTADLGTAPWAESWLGKACPALRADLIARGLLDPTAARRSARAALGGAFLLTIAGTLGAAAGIGDVPEPLVAALMCLGSAFALLARALTLPETSDAGESEGQAWRARLDDIGRPGGDPNRIVDLGSDLPFVLAAGRPDLVPRLEAEAATCGSIPAWLHGDGGEGRSGALALCHALVAEEDTASATVP